MTAIRKAHASEARDRRQIKEVHPGAQAGPRRPSRGVHLHWSGWRPGCPSASLADRRTARPRWRPVDDAYAVGADQASPVEAEDDVEVLHRDVVDDLVVAALQERGIDRGERLHAVSGEARGEGDRVPLGYPDIEKPLRKLL
jgi:hypothetical protein